MAKQLQFELWQECNSKCKFCYLGHMNLCTSIEEKINNIEYVINKLSDMSIYPEYDTVAFIGGEFFQGQMETPLVKDKFFELMRLVNDLKNKGYLKNVWIYATMTIGDQKDLYDTIDIFDDKHNLWILTSYDTMGRFHTPKMEETWSYNMKHIHELYADIKFNTTIILSADFIEKYLRNEFIIQDFMNEYNTTVYFKVPNRVKDKFTTNKDMNDMIGNFFPTRSLFLSFLKKVKTTESEDIWNRLFEMNLRADTLICKHNGSLYESERDKEHFTELYDENLDYVMKCGHLSIYNPYVDKEGCAICDKKMIEEIL
jgi:hypothetical protein